MSSSDELMVFRVDRRELATVLAALRFHQDENLQGGVEIADQVIGDIATDGGTLKALDFAEVEQLCHRLNLEEPKQACLHIDPPGEEHGDRPLFRVVYVIDVNADDVRQAAEEARQMMVSADSLPPVLQVIGHTGGVSIVDLSAT